MSSISDTDLPLINGNQYHIFNRGNQSQNIFYLKKNYSFFLERYAKYMNNYWDTYSYALLPNHFHLAVELKPTDKIIETATVDFPRIGKNFLKNYLPVNEIFQHPDLLSFKNLVSLSSQRFHQLFQRGNPTDFHEHLLQWVVSERFRRFLMSYAKAINKQEGLTGSLFQKLFRRKLIEENGYLAYLILYHHRNPIHHGRALTLMDWLWTSYHSILSDRETKLQRAKVLELFGGREAFVKKHDDNISDWKNKDEWFLE